MFERTMRRVGALSFICIATIWAAPATAQDRAWLESLPDPDGFVWEKPDRPGYRYRGMTASQQRFYDYVQGKRMRGEALSGVEVLMIRSLQAARRCRRLRGRTRSFAPTSTTSGSSLRSNSTPRTG